MHNMHIICKNNGGGGSVLLGYSDMYILIASEKIIVLYEHKKFVAILAIATLALMNIGVAKSTKFALLVQLILMDMRQKLMVCCGF